MKKIVVVLMSILAMLVAACGGSNAEAISTDNGGKLCRVKIKLTAVRLWSCIIRGQVIPRLLPE